MIGVGAGGEDVLEELRIPGDHSQELGQLFGLRLGGREGGLTRMTLKVPIVDLSSDIWICYSYTPGGYRTIFEQSCP